MHVNKFDNGQYRFLKEFGLVTLFCCLYSMVVCMGTCTWLFIACYPICSVNADLEYKNPDNFTQVG